MHTDASSRRLNICRRHRRKPRGIIFRAPTEASPNLATLFRTARRLPRDRLIERDRLELDYAALAERTLALAGGLQTLGVASGDRVGMLMKHCEQYIELLYACWTIGACAIPINARLHPRETAFILDDAGALVCFVTEDADSNAIDAARSSGKTRFRCQALLTNRYGTPSCPKNSTMRSNSGCSSGSPPVRLTITPP